MPEEGGSEKKKKICLLGASFDTGNMGVTALAESSIKIILNQWPNAEVILLGSGYVPQQRHLFLLDKEICVRTLPIRFSKNIFLPYHFLWFVFYGLLAKLLPSSRLKDALVNRNRYFRLLFETDLVADITGGDSFSDIYGFRRFFLGFLCKWLIFFLGKELILLPQTYGPFSRRPTRIMARYILRHASLVYSRGQEGLEYVRNLVGGCVNNVKVRFAPEVAFVLDSRKPYHFDMSPLSRILESRTVVGLNVSGLLFNGGYTQDNMFALKTDYRALIYNIVEMLLEDKNVIVLLVPHVFPPPGYEVESDPKACLEIYKHLNQRYPERMVLVQGEYDHNEIKYIIGLCDFFIGSRMHSCIAAMSQCIPTVGIAYSKKFQEVFETVDMGHVVADMKSNTQEEILMRITKAFQERLEIGTQLKSVIPQLRKTTLNLFNDIP